MNVDMKRLAIVLTLLIWGESAVAQWIAVGQSSNDEGETFTRFADPSTMRRNAERVKIWQLSDYGTDQQFKGKAYRSRKAQIEADCDRARYRVLSFNDYSGQMATGTMIGAWNSSPTWLPVYRGTVGEASWRFACVEKHRAEVIRAHMDERNISGISIEGMQNDSPDSLGERMRSELRSEQLLLEQSGRRETSMSSWIDKIKSKVKGNLVIPIDLNGNPESTFVVVLLPTGEVLSAKLGRSSGHAAFDLAVERAILKSSPLPKPATGEVFSREVTVRFRPQD